MILHSRHSSIDLPQLAEWAAAIGADQALRAVFVKFSQQALAMASAAGVALGDEVCRHALTFARSVVPAQVQVEALRLIARAALSATPEVLHEAHSAAGRRHRSPGHRPYVGARTHLQPGRRRPGTDRPDLPGTCRRLRRAEGLAQFIRDEGIDLLLDATHPYAAQISHNAARAAQLTGIPCWALRRPAWQPQPGDDWREVSDWPN